MTHTLLVILVTAARYWIAAFALYGFAYVARETFTKNKWGAIAVMALCLAIAHLLLFRWPASLP